jgi:hypothetical protein
VERELVFGPDSFGLACQHMGLSVYQRMGPDPHVARPLYSHDSVPLHVACQHMGCIPDLQSDFNI